MTVLGLLELEADVFQKASPWPYPQKYPQFVPAVSAFAVVVAAALTASAGADVAAF